MGNMDRIIASSPDGDSDGDGGRKGGRRWGSNSEPIGREREVEWRREQRRENREEKRRGETRGENGQEDRKRAQGSPYCCKRALPPHLPNWAPSRGYVRLLLCPTQDCTTTGTTLNRFDSLPPFHSLPPDSVANWDPVMVLEAPSLPGRSGRPLLFRPHQTPSRPSLLALRLTVRGRDRFDRNGRSSHWLGLPVCFRLSSNRTSPSLPAGPVWAYL